MNPTTASQSAQQVLAAEQQLLARRGAAQEVLEQIDRELNAVRAVIRGIQIGQQLAAEAATPAEPEGSQEA